MERMHEDDFLHTEAFAWCKGKEFKEESEHEHELDGKNCIILFLLVIILVIIVATVLNQKFGFEFY